MHLCSYTFFSSHICSVAITILRLKQKLLFLLCQCLRGDPAEGLHQLGHRPERRWPHRKPHEEHEPNPPGFHHGAGKRLHFQRRMEFSQKAVQLSNDVWNRVWFLAPAEWSGPELVVACSRTVVYVTQGMYGINEEVYLSLPCVLYGGGVASVINMTLTEDEVTQLQDSARTLWDIQKDLQDIWVATRGRCSAPPTLKSTVWTVTRQQKTSDSRQIHLPQPQHSHRLRV